MKRVFRKFVGFSVRPLKGVLRRYLIAARRRKQAHDYHVWATENEDRCFVGSSTEDVLFSVVVPAYNTDPAHIREMVMSVVNQHYERWELVIANGSPDASRSADIQTLSDIDTRIRVLELGENKGISATTNSALAEATGDYIVFFDHDDLMHPCALHSFADAARHHPDVIHSDEDKISDDSTRYFDSFIKPGWSPHLFENANYINHLTAVEKSVVDAVGKLRPAFDGAQDYDFLLRVVDSKKDVVVHHIPRVLYHWRAAPTSTASDISTKTYVLDAGEKALNEHLTRRAIHGSATAIANRPGWYKTVYDAPKDTRVSIVIGSVAFDVRPHIVPWLDAIVPLLPGVENIYLGDWSDVKEVQGIPVLGYDESKVLSQKELNGDVAVYCSMAFTPPNPDANPLAAMVGLAARGHVVAPVVLAGTDIRATGLVETDEGLRPLFEGEQYGTSSLFGINEWVRDVAALKPYVVCMPTKAFAQDPHTLQLAPDISYPSVLWSHDPLQGLGDFRYERQTSQLSSSYGADILFFRRLFRG